MRARLALICGVAAAAALVSQGVPAFAAPSPVAGANVRVTVDSGAQGAYHSADQLAGGSYTDGVLQRCGTDRRMQNEPTLAIDPRDHSVWAAGSNDYCTVPTAGDAWAGFYRSTTSGASWTDSLLPGYSGDTSAQGLSSPVHQQVLGGAIAAGDPMMSWDGQGNLFYMGNNFNRGTENGASGLTKDNTGDIWVATYAPANPADHSTDGSKYVRTVILAHNTFGLGSFNDKTDLTVDPATGNIYAAWSDFHGLTGCNETGGALARAPGAANGAAYVTSSDFGQTFTKARIAVHYAPFVFQEFSGNGARECGDGPFACPTGFTFPRSDLAGPYLATDNMHGTVVMGFQARQPSGQGQIEFAFSTDGGATWSAPKVLAPAATGHQFFPWLAASDGRVSAIWDDSQGDPDYAANRAPCNSATGHTSACLNVRYAESTDGGKTWGSSIQVTDTPTNLNYEQFGGRLVPFFGDYITVATQGSTVGAVWTDQRNTVGAADASGDNDGADVAGDPETGGKCTTSADSCFDGTGGLDQNIYTASITP